MPKPIEQMAKYNGYRLQSLRCSYHHTLYTLPIVPLLRLHVSEVEKRAVTVFVPLPFTSSTARENASAGNDA